MFHWYVINTYSGHENKVKANLEHRIVSMNQQPAFRRVVVPAGAQPQKAQVEFSLGESVKVTSGPLSDFDGEIVDVNPDQQKLKVLVDIFERQVPVELAFDQVKKID